MNYYNTNADGMFHIKTTANLSENDYITIDSDIYLEDNLYKVKSIKNNQLELKLVKLIECEVVNDKIDEFKPTQLYSNEINEDILFANKINKGQILVLNNKFYEVIDIQKLVKQPKLLKLKSLDVTEVKSIYRVFQKSQETFKESIYDMYESYLDAILSVAKGRSRCDGYYYYLK